MLGWAFATVWPGTKFSDDANGRSDRTMQRQGDGSPQRHYREGNADLDERDDKSQRAACATQRPSS